MRAVQTGPLVGLISQLALLGVLAGTVGLGSSSWLVGVASALVITAALNRGLVRRGVGTLGPADRVTLTRATLVCGVAALTAEALGGAPHVGILVTLSAVALVLDAVDGWVARRTGTASPLGARFDLEVDAFLILVLSIYVADELGPWVLAIGAARYVFVAAGWWFPWLDEQAPPRHWCKVVAAIQGVVLTAVAADVLPQTGETGLLAVSLALLAESFGREAWWLWRHRDPRARRRPVGAGLATGLAVLLVWFGLTAPNQLGDLTPGAFLRIPLEALLVVAVVVVLPPAARRALGIAAGVVLGLLTVVKVLDMGFYTALGRSFDAAIDWRYLGSGLGFLDESVGRPVAIVLTVAAALLALAILVLMPLAVLRLTRVASGHRTASLRAVAALAPVWIVCALLGVHLARGVPVASASAADYAYGQVSRIPSEIRDEREFSRDTVADPLRSAPADGLLTGLRGKDVLFVFVESYGRVAVQDSSMAPGVDAVLDDGTASLRAQGFSARSAFLTSPTFGAISWLAHSTLQSGLWVDSQQRYDVLMSSNRFTLGRAFERAGWRTVGDVPANTHDWPQGAFYGYDKLYDSRNVGYEGPRFGYPTMPDQYTLDAFHRLELSTAHRKPVMAEIDLITSHAPWSRTPHMIEQSRVGDGSVYAGMPEQAPSKSVIWRSPERVRAAYGESIEYSLNALITFVRTYADDNTVLVFLGDHQPATVVSGEHPGHDVPITVVARDPAVLDRIAAWGWQDGLNPGPDAPVWRMDAFRDRFLAAYGPQ